MDQRNVVRIPRKSKKVYSRDKDDLRWFEERSRTCRSHRISLRFYQVEGEGWKDGRKYLKTKYDIMQFIRLQELQGSSFSNE